MSHDTDHGHPNPRMIWTSSFSGAVKRTSIMANLVPRSGNREIDSKRGEEEERAYPEYCKGEFRDEAPRDLH